MHYNKFKYILTLIVLLVFFFPLYGKTAQTLTVGASASPHAEILEQVKPILAKKGITLKVIIFQDYIIPNKALAQKSLDANYYQHLAFLQYQNKIFGYNLISVGNIHYEPIGLYSNKFTSLNEITPTITVLMSNSVADRGRFLNILEEINLIKLKDFKTPEEKANANFNDIISNPKNLKFKFNIQPSLMPKMFLNNVADLIFINTNYAITANIDPKIRSLFLEKNINPLYANILVTRKDNANDPKIKALLETLHSENIKSFILKKYKGLILPLN